MHGPLGHASDGHASNGLLQGYSAARRRRGHSSYEHTYLFPFRPVPTLYPSFYTASQVHRAVGLDGRQLAVKVQHGGLREGAAADVATISVAVDLLRYFAPDYDFRWVVGQTRENLPQARETAHLKCLFCCISFCSDRKAGTRAVPLAETACR